ncbi:MAG: hypothetical protein JWR67_377 [Mucilaginibacter sp.]|nr:hypothetical protein [Mucilaginibacter sp.]MDB5109263.1 hypothetical protein [Mucilaginibacter sp.]
MRLVYSALRNINQQENHTTSPATILSIRYKAYQATCQKYDREIVAIQKYLPGWTPAFNY